MSSFLQDEPIDNAARFGFDVYSKALSVTIKSKGLETPFTISIHGDWGSGKTSLMKTVAKELQNIEKNEVRVRTIWFDAWEFEKVPIPLWKIFLNRITMDLQENVEDSRLKDKLKAAGAGLLLLASDVMLKSLAGTSLNDIEAIKSRVWEDIRSIKSLGEDFSQCIEAALQDDPDKPERLVVFVDDLDRCMPDHCVEVFESIKLFLNSKKCIFVIGMNRDQICKAFEITFKEKGISGLNYLEKFVQLQFDLPRKNPVEVQSFLMDYASEQLRKSPKTIELISRFIESNPRKIKRWLNSVIFLEELFRVRQQEQITTTKIDVSLVSIWLFLKSFFSDFANMIEKDQTMLNAAIRVSHDEATLEEKTKTGSFLVDQRLEDFLSTLKSDIDEEQLRDVVYLSRLTPIEQISTMPPEVLTRISSMSDEELYAQINRLSEDNLLSLVDKTIESLAEVKDLHGYRDNVGLYNLLDRIMVQIEEDSKLVLLYNKIRSIMEKNRYASRFFSGRMPNYARNDAIKEMLLGERAIQRKQCLNLFQATALRTQVLIRPCCSSSETNYRQTICTA